jgi:hypothetical protein
MDNIKPITAELESWIKPILRAGLDAGHYARIIWRDCEDEDGHFEIPARDTRNCAPVTSYLSNFGLGVNHA